MEENQFKILFYQEMKRLSKIKKNEKEYHFYAYQNEENWKGINIRKLIIKAHNRYEMWLKFDKLLPHYDYELFMTCIEEAEIDPPSMEENVKEILRMFKGNDTLRYKKMN